MGEAREAVFCRETFWRDTIRVSTNVIAEHFVAAGWRCAWLTTPLTLTTRWYRQGPHRQRLALWRAGGRQAEVLEYTPAIPFGWSWRPGLRSPWLGRNALRFACPSLARVLARHGYRERPGLLWIGSLAMASVARVLRAERVAYHAHDLFMDYPGAPPELQHLERWLVARVDAVFTTSACTRDALVERYHLDPAMVHVLGHGVHLERYGAAAEPPELAAIPRPRAVVLCIGPGGAPIAGMAAARGLANVHVLGPRPHEDIPAFLLHADVGLILYPFAGARSRRAGPNPMKLYEYAAASLPLARTSLPERERLAAPFLSPHDPE